MLRNKVDECQKEGLKDSTWKDNSNGVTLTFNGPRALPTRQKIKTIHFSDRIGNINDGNDDVNSDGNSDVDTAIHRSVIQIIDEVSNDGIIDGISNSITDELINIVSLLFKHEELTTSDIVSSSDKSKPTIERYISLAKKAGLIDYKGTRRQGTYFLTDEVNEMIHKSVSDS